MCITTFSSMKKPPLQTKRSLSISYNGFVQIALKSAYISERDCPDRGGDGSRPSRRDRAGRGAKEHKVKFERTESDV
jgi:hypothetical protein